MDRYFVDARCGCVAIRDRLNTDSEYHGLHSGTEGVVKYWHGESIEKECPHCHQSMGAEWFVPEETMNEAIELCGKLNTESYTCTIHDKQEGGHDGS